uniref:Uncharacterized protein n=1 Tax=Leersia perrieri TaxID=77586 RepID=A0A0D9X289_9ORYZ
MDRLYICELLGKARWLQQASIYAQIGHSRLSSKVLDFVIGFIGYAGDPSTPPADLPSTPRS